MVGVGFDFVLNLNVSLCWTWMLVGYRQHSNCSLTGLTQKEKEKKPEESGRSDHSTLILSAQSWASHALVILYLNGIVHLMHYQESGFFSFLFLSLFLFFLRDSFMFCLLLIDRWIIRVSMVCLIYSKLQFFFSLDNLIVPFMKKQNSP